MVSFCNKCGALLSPNKNEKGKMQLTCLVCKVKSKEKFKNETYAVKQKIIHDSVKEKLTVIEESFDIRPITNQASCIKCGNNEARYWEAENRKKEDWESATYYKCTKCGWVWTE